MRFFRWCRTAVIGFAAIILATVNGLGLPANAAQNSTKAATSQNLSISLGNNSSIQFRDAHFMVYDQGKIVAFTLSIFNNGNSQLDLSDYWVRLKDTSNRTYNVKVAEADKNKQVVPAKSSMYLTYYAQVNSSVDLSQLRFVIEKWDPSASGYVRSLGSIYLSENYSDKTAAFQANVMLYNNTKIRSALKGYNVISDENYHYLTINYLIENVGFQSTTLDKMTFYVQTRNGTIYNVNAGDLAKISVQPSERKIITLSARMPAAVSTEGIWLTAAASQGGEINMLPIGSFALPMVKQSAAAEPGTVKTLYFEGIPVNITTGQLQSSDNGNTQIVSLDVSLTNTGSKSMTAPSLKYSLKNGNGVLYPLGQEGSGGELLPGIEEVIQLTGTIPVEMELNNMEVVVHTTGAEGIDFLLANYKVKATNNQGSVGQSFTYDSLDIHLDQIQRSSQESGDMVVVELTIENDGKTAKAIPALSGYFKINGVKIPEDRTTVTVMDEVTVLLPGESYRLIAFADISHSTKINTAEFVLTEKKEGGQASKTLYTFSTNKTSSVRTIAPSESYVIDYEGKRAEVKLLKSAIYDGDRADYFYAEFELTNKESRSVVPAEIGGYIRVENSESIPLTFTAFKEPVFANGKVFVTGIAKIPVDYPRHGIEFFIGQKVARSSDGGASALVNQQVYKLKAEDIDSTRSDFHDLRFVDHYFSLKNFSASLKGVAGGFSFDGIDLAFYYDLQKTVTYYNKIENHKLILEYVDAEDERTRYSTEITFDPYSKDGVYLKQGKDIRKVITFDDPDVMSKLSHRKYIVNLYHVYQDNELLLASREMIW